MKTHELLELLELHKDKNLQFEYKQGHFVAPNYHITEVKNIIIDSVDCGAGVDFWKETIIQLWESPDKKDDEGVMSSFKALGILKKVDRIKTMTKEAEVKFEYSNDDFHTAQLFVNDYELQNNNLVIKLAVHKTDCKARETCGVPVAVAVESKEASCCTPESGCC